MQTRRTFIKWTSAGGFGLFLSSKFGAVSRLLPDAVSGGILIPSDIPKYETPLLIPPVMPRAGTNNMHAGKPADYYEISVRQFRQQILPAPLPRTTVWG